MRTLWIFIVVGLWVMGCLDPPPALDSVGAYPVGESTGNPSNEHGSACDCLEDEVCYEQQGVSTTLDPVCTSCESFLVLDEPNGIYWQKHRLGELTQSHDEATAYCQSLSQCGLNDWRLPTVEEFKSLFGNCYIHPFGLMEEPWLDYYCDACWEGYLSDPEGWGTGEKSQRCESLFPKEAEHFEGEKFAGMWTSKKIEMVFSDESGSPGNYQCWEANLAWGRVGDSSCSFSSVRCVHDLSF